MAPISKPDPIPVEVINALVGVLLVVELLDELGEMAELIRFASARYVVQFIGNYMPDLSKRRTKNSQIQAA
jgi:hypothetical protein